MVTNLIQQPKGSVDQSNEKMLSEQATVDQRFKDLSFQNAADKSEMNSSGHLESSGSETNYLGATHWVAILENVSNLDRQKNADFLIDAF